MSTTSTPPAEWSALLIDAVAKPGLISDAYSRLWNYSTGNQLLAMWQCAMRGIAPGPIHTFKGWQSLGRNVTKGQKAIELCMPVTCKRTEKDKSTGDEKSVKFARFIYRKNWFVLSQTDGAEYVPASLPDWNEDRALTALNVCRVDYTSTRGNAMGVAFGRMVAVSPLAHLPTKTLFHEIAHVLLGHTDSGEMNDDESTPRNIEEVEAESVALIVCESLGLPGAEYSRGYIQHWLRGGTIPETSARKIFKTADAILKAGRPAAVPADAE